MYIYLMWLATINIMFMQNLHTATFAWRQFFVTTVQIEQTWIFFNKRSCIFYLPKIDKQSVTHEACRENIAKLIPFSASEAPSGKAMPGEYFNGTSVPNIGVTFSYCGITNNVGNHKKNI